MFRELIKPLVDLSWCLPRNKINQFMLFIHIPKNAGSSISEVMYGKQIGHKKLRDYQNFRRFDEYDVVAVVRNPYDRFLSAYNYLKISKYKDDQKFSKTYGLERRSMEYVLRDLHSRGGQDHIYLHFEPQSYFLHSTKDPRSKIYLRHECLRQDFAQLINEDIEVVNIPVLNKNNTVQTSLDPKLRTLIESVYYDDLTLWYSLWK